MRGKLIFSSAGARVTQRDPALSIKQDLSHRLSHQVAGVMMNYVTGQKG